MSIKAKIRGKINAFQKLVSFAKYLSNWKEAFSAYQKKKPAPPLTLRSGITIHHSESDDVWSLFDEIFEQQCYTGKGFYSPKRGDHIMDCGANIGFFALYLSSFSKGLNIHCFEPSSNTQKRLRNNIDSNSLSQQIKVHPFAVLNKKGTIPLVQTAFAGDASSFLTSDKAENVPCVPLAEAVSMCNTKTIDLLKMDVEGAEIEILVDADDSLFKNIKRIALEYHEEIRPGCTSALKRKLEKNYRYVEFWPTTPNGALGIMRASNA